MGVGDGLKRLIFLDFHNLKLEGRILNDDYLIELGGDPPPLGDVLADDLDNFQVSRLPLH